VPADPSSSIPSALTQLAPADPLRPTERPHLLGYLAAVGDPRARGGRRHPLVAILAIAAAAVLAGARSIAAIAEWAADTPQPVRAALGTRFDPLTGRWSVPRRARSAGPWLAWTLTRLRGRSAPGWLTSSAGTGRSRTACITCATSPLPKTPPGSGPAPPRRSWPACATLPSVRSAGPGRSTSPLRYAITAAIHADHSPPSGSSSGETDITQERRSPGRGRSSTTGRRTCAYSVSRSIASAMARIPVSFGCTPSPLSYSGRIRSGSVGSANTRSRSTTAS
jgi:hypothetical protein